MQYFGGKAKIAKELSGVLNKYLEGNDKPFIDAFCGSCNVISKIDDKRIRIANDKHKELIAMWQWVKKMGVDRLPTDVSKELYYYIKTSTTSPDWLKGFVGFGCSFAGKWWGGYATSDNKERNYATNAINTIAKKLKGIAIPSVLGVIYCDIPYKSSTGYSVGTFSHEAFYQLGNKMKALGHTVLVSEYEMNVDEAMRENIVWRKESKKDIRDKDDVQQKTIEVLLCL